jgi:DNA-binding transcriptional LysR family regulator
MDIAFVDAYIMDSRISLKTVYKEKHHLICSKGFAKDKKVNLKKDDIENLDCVAYLKNAPIIRGWLRKQLGEIKFNLKIVSKSMDVAGVATLIKAGMGIGILPEHAIKKYLDPNEIVHLNNKNQGQENEISLAYLSSKREQRPIKDLIEFFLAKAK